MHPSPDPQFGTAAGALPFHLLSRSAVPSPSSGQLDERMRHLDRLASLGTLSASFAHEIRNALVSVRTFVDLLLEQNKNAELAETVRHEIIRIDSIVWQMLRFSGTQRSTEADFGLHELLLRLMRALEPQLSARAIRLQTVFQAPADSVRGNSQQLEQAFMNLFLNALDAIGREGEIAIGTAFVPDGKTAGKRLHVTVSDTGHGITPEQMSRLFEPFFTTKPEGTGLGLAITRQIIELHSGTISVASDPGKGSVFHIVLPLMLNPAN